MSYAQTPPHVDNYMIGKGILSIAKITGGVTGTYADVGNCTKFEFQMTEETKEHFASRTSTKEMDAEVVIMTGYTLDFSLDEVSVENMRMFLKGTEANKVIYANQNANQYYALKFISDNPAGPNVKYEFWKCKLSPNGAFSLIGDDFTTMSFSGKGMSDRTGHSTSPFFTSTFQTTTSTTTTTTTTTAALSSQFNIRWVITAHLE